MTTVKIMPSIAAAIVEQVKADTHAKWSRADLELHPEFARRDSFEGVTSYWFNDGSRIWISQHVTGLPQWNSAPPR